MAQLQNDRNNELDELLERIANNPQDALACLDYASMLYKSDRLDEAEQYCNKAISLDAKLPLPYVLLSHIYFRQGKDPQISYQLAETAYSYSPETLDAILCLGSASLLVGKDEQGIQLLEKAKKIDPGNFEVHHNLLVGYSRLKNSEKTYIEAKHLYRLRPSFENGIMWIISLLNLRYMTMTLAVILIGSIVLAVIIKSEILLVLPVIYLLLMLLGGIYSLKYHIKRQGVLLIISALLFLFLLYLISIYVIK